MVDPYKAGFFTENPYAAKRAIKGKLAVILRGKLEKRGLELITTISRAVLKDEVHELIVTDEEAVPGGKVNKIAYLGFIEITEGGVMTVGDTLTCENKVLGKVVGFDETHLPNHLNIVVASAIRADGVEQKLRLESEVVCKYE